MRTWKPTLLTFLVSLILLVLFLLAGFIVQVSGSIIFTKHTVASLSNARDVHTIDMDGDGNIDILGADTDLNLIAWWENDGNQNFSQYTIQSDFSGASAVYAADLDKDGDVDVLGGSSDSAGKIAWWENDGNQHFVQHIIVNSFASFSYVRDIYSIDIDGDGDIDILGAGGYSSNGRIAWWENDGNQNFIQHDITNNLPTSWFWYTTSVYAIDIDDDGDIDVLGTSYYFNEIAWWENDGNQQFTRHTLDNNFSLATSVFAIDLDGDGDIDVLGGAAASDEDIQWWENDGNQNFSHHHIGSGSFDVSYSVYAIDLDGDADKDILGAGIGLSNSGSILWWENDGNQNFTQHIIAPGQDGSWAPSMYATDMDGDGDIDVLKTADGGLFDPSNIAWWENTGGVTPPPQPTSITFRVSIATNGTQANNQSLEPSLSDDGRYVEFTSWASNLVGNDTNGMTWDVFVYDTQTNQIRMVSVDSQGTVGNSASTEGSISGNGRYVSFSSLASNLVPNDTNDKTDVFVHDLLTGQTTRVSLASDGSQMDEHQNYFIDNDISSDGRYVTFSSDASDLVANDTNNSMDVFVRDRSLNQTTRVSVSSDGSQGNDGSGPISISSDGQFVVFSSLASNLVSGDLNETSDVFVHDRQTGQTSRISVDSEENEANSASGFSGGNTISGDNRYVVFNSLASNLVNDDTNGYSDVFVRDVVADQTWRVSKVAGGSEANGNSRAPTISKDGRYVMFMSEASNLVANDTNGALDVFLYNMRTQQIVKISLSSEDVQGNLDSFLGGISANGQRVTFDSEATNLVPNDTNGWRDIFVRDLNVGSDTTSPAAITNLTATAGSTPGTIDLSWTAPGDDDNIGTATNYLIRYADDTIVSELDWATATEVNNVSIPQVAGTTENMTISGLTPGLPYFFMIRAEDETSNLGGLGNSPRAVPSVGLLIHVPVMWCAVEGSPASEDTSVLNQRITRINHNVYAPQSRILFESALAPGIQFEVFNHENNDGDGRCEPDQGEVCSTDFPMISDPNPDGPEPFANLGDIQLSDEEQTSDEFNQALDNCRNVWNVALSDAGVTGHVGVIALNVRKFVNHRGVYEGILGVGGLGGQFSAELGFAAVMDYEFTGGGVLNDERGFMFAHEVGHALTLHRTLDDPPIPHHSDRNNLMYGQYVPLYSESGQLTNNPSNLDDLDTQVGRARAQAIRYIGTTTEPPLIDPPFGDSIFALTENLIEAESFIDLASVGFNQNQKDGVTTLYALTAGPLPNDIENISYWFLIDSDGDSGTGASSAETTNELEIPLSFEGVDYLFQVQLMVTGGVPHVTPVAKHYENNAFITFADPSIQADVGQIVHGVWVEEGTQDPGIVSPPETLITFQFDSNLLVPLANPRLQGVTKNFNTQTVDMSDEKELSFNLPNYPNCSVTPETLVQQGEELTIVADNLSANSTYEVFFGDQLVATGLTDVTGNATASFLLPENADSGVRPVSISIENTAISANCIVNIEGKMNDYLPIILK